MPEHRLGGFTQGRMHWKPLGVTPGEIRRYRLLTQPQSYDEGMVFVWKANPGSEIRVKWSVVPPGHPLLADAKFFTDIVPASQRADSGEVHIKEPINHITVGATGTGGILAVYGDCDFYEVDESGKAIGG